MKILVVSFRFPPYNSVGAVSVGKTVKYLAALGHDVRVLCARDQQLPATVPLEVDARWVVSTGWLNPMRIAQPAAGGRARVEATGFSAGRKHDRAVHRLGRVYRSVMVPDPQIGWAWPAFRAGREIVKRWRPDVIFASAPPFTSLIVGGALAFRTGIPWVAGLRDLWSDNPYRQVRLARLDRLLESRVLGSASGIVVTTREDLIRARFRVPTRTVMNGYDPDDARARERTPGSPSEQFRIVHTGTLWLDRRDPTPLFEAMRSLRTEKRTVVADFYGRDSLFVTKKADLMGLADQVRAHGQVSHEDSLQAQRDADVLLLIQPDNADERLICPAKMFEYAAARRPVLLIGPSDGVVARLVDEFGLGIVARHADDVGAALGRWHEQKASRGGLPDVAERPPEDWSRPIQVQKLSDFLERVVLDPWSAGSAISQADDSSTDQVAWLP